MTDAKPPVHVELIWDQDLRFAATSGDTAIVTDGNSAAGPSPVQLVAIGLAGCMAADLVDILKKGRHPLTALHAKLDADRAPEPPRRLTAVRLHFAVQGEVPAAAVERAIALSHDKYCSVWHSLRQDITFSIAYDLLG